MAEVTEKCLRCVALETLLELAYSKVAGYEKQLARAGENLCLADQIYTAAGKKHAQERELARLRKDVDYWKVKYIELIRKETVTGKHIRKED